MKVLKRGWQYSVYDLENGRVLKKYNNFFVAYFVMLKDSFLQFAPPVVNFFKLYRNSKMQASRSLAFISNSALDKALFGHPTILDEFTYEQIYVEPLSHYLKRVSLEEGEKVIDAFISFNKQLVEHAVIEKNFSIANNFGISKEGDIVLMDLGELETTKEGVQSRIEKRAWSTPDVLAGIPVKLRKYFVQKMDEAFHSN